MIHPPLRAVRDDHGLVPQIEKRTDGGIAFGELDHEAVNGPQVQFFVGFRRVGRWSF